MVDRTDIDALLIGSLYGELSSADEARLNAHLESHPADRTAFDGLVRTRDAVRASRIFEIHAEPPQSISALLVQEAARRAPKAPKEAAGEGWFARLRRSFLMHPAMAAAAMLVVVASVASTVYVRKGDHFAAPEVARNESAAAAGQAAGSAAPAQAAPTGMVAAPPPAAYGDTADTAAMEGQAQVVAADPAAAPAKVAQATRDADSYRVGLADGKDQAELPKKAERAYATAPEPETGAAAEKPKVARRGALLEVATPQPAPKEIDDVAKNAKGRVQRDYAKPADEAPLAEPMPDAKRGDLTASRTPAPPPPPPAAVGMAKAPAASAGGGAPGAMGGAGAAAAPAEDGNVDGNLAWAKEQHARLINQVRAGQCTAAAGTAVALSNRAPGYYQQNVENDRAIKDCLAYITAERDQADEQARARAATVRRSADEAAAPAPKQAIKQAPKQAPKKAAPAKPAAADRADPGTATKSH
jgi:hypothetical protein